MKRSFLTRFLRPRIEASPEAAAEAEKLWDAYAQQPDTHVQVPNVSYAGYQRGETETPVHAGPEFSVMDYGADPSGGTPSDAALKDALSAAEETGGGVVTFPEGTYLLTSPVWVHGSHLIIRGAGQDRTTLYFDRPLEEGYRKSRMGEWSWAGGLVWFIPPELRRQLEENDWAWGTNEGWLESTELTAITAHVPRGSTVIPLADTRMIREGEHVMLSADATADSRFLAHLCGDLSPESYDFESLRRSLHRQRNYRRYKWPVLVREVRQNEAVLAQPTKIDLRPEWSPRLNSLGPRIEESGIESLTIRMRPSPQQPHNRDRGFNGPHFQAALNCWAKDVSVVDSENGFGLTSAKGVTLERVAVEGQARHHSFICREQTHDSLVHDFTIGSATTELAEEAKTHGLNVEGYSSGNVWSRGEMEGTFDSHRRLPFENVRTEITIRNRGTIGGAKTAGPHWGARFVHWNIAVPNRRAYAVRIEEHAPYSAMVGVRGPDKAHPQPHEFTGHLHSTVLDLGTEPTPANLYLAQLRHRLGPKTPNSRKDPA